MEAFRSMLQSIDDGDISMSPYDTAWAAMVRDIGGRCAPQFPSSLEWIAIKQFHDGGRCAPQFTSSLVMVHGVPNVYPVNLFEHLRATDRLQQLGVSRYFESEIEDCLHYVSRYWTNKGILCARNSKFQDIDDTARGFRLLRLRGYDVSADLFQQFKNGEEFFCCGRQSNHAVTGIYNLYRASEVMFPGENVGYALDVPWYASLPRLGTRFYLEQYGGEDDAWIGKT
ncbi:ent-copalyl diphosphate synthase, chloroplastic-like [Olea europaea subsp. europaea]|uniref:Ent-copalyl diphosphate synthase, chloroplastic-like n=1 Tax=Olea europaea subsp. europaea TaxID=158383 RepID=A0A8S0URH7_OLEEU|nr:ent-copalyl diphosphate synthase, chloroplastic-like [Olea europaea subsp. europaea]